MINDVIQTDFAEANDNHWQNADLLPMWTIYRPTTTDYAGKWVARMFLTLPTTKATNIVLIDETLEQLRNRLPEGLALLERNQFDDPNIEEVWL